MRRTRAAAAAGAVAIAACGGSADGGSGGGTAPPAEARRAIVVDTDGGSDDAMALLYLLQHPAVEVLAITVSGTGIVHCDEGVDNVAGLVDLAAPGSSVPTGCGPERPVAGDRAFPEEWRDQADGRYGGILPSGSAEAGDATDVLAGAVLGADRPVTVLTLGPLTNLAVALGERPELAAAIDDVVVMGGSFDGDGNVFLDGEPAAATTEWNIYVDPQAAADVLASGVPVTFVPLDAQVPVDPYVLRTLAREAATPAATTIATLLASSPFFVSGEFAFWDPLAAAAVADPDLFSVSRHDVTVQTDGPEAGRTTRAGGGPAGIATVVAADEFVARYLGTLDGRDSPVAFTRVPDVRIRSGEGVCEAEPATVTSGPAVLVVHGTGAAAVGTIEAGRTDAEIDRFLATSPTKPPPWVEVDAVLVAGGPAAVAYADLEPGPATLLCLRTPPAAPPTVAARTALVVTP